MVVGGLPERDPTHAECVANQALDMMHYCQQVNRPDTNEPIVVCQTLSHAHLLGNYMYVHLCIP